MGKLLGSKTPEGLYDLLGNKAYLAALKAHAKSEMNESHVDFLLAMRKMKSARQAQMIYDRYIPDEAPDTVNIGMPERTAAVAYNAQNNKDLAGWKNVLEDCETEVESLVTHDTLGRFWRSAPYKAVLFKKHPPRRIAQKLSITTPQGLATLSDAMIDCAVGKPEWALDKGLILFRNDNEADYQTNPKDFVAALWSGNFSRATRKRKATDAQLSRMARDNGEGEAPDLPGRKVKVLLDFIGLKKFRDQRSAYTLAKVVHNLNNRDAARARGFFDQIKRQEPTLSNARITWDQFRTTLKKAKLIR